MPAVTVYVDPSGTEYVAVKQDGCEGCAFNTGPIIAWGRFTAGCYESPNCNAANNGGKSIIWVRKGDET